jgi:hypothetical protein
LVLIFDTEPYRFQKFISDLAGMDINAHGGDVEVAISKTRDWLVNVSRSHPRINLYLPRTALDANKPMCSARTRMGFIAFPVPTG